MVIFILDVCHCSQYYNEKEEQQKRLTISIARCKQDERSKYKRKKEKPIDKKIERNQCCVEAIKKCFYGHDIRRDNREKTNIRNIDYEKSQGGLKFRYGSHFPNCEGDKLKIVECPKEFPNKYDIKRVHKEKSNKRNIDKSCEKTHHGGLKFRFTSHSPQDERNRRTSKVAEAAEECSLRRAFRKNDKEEMNRNLMNQNCEKTSAGLRFRYRSHSPSIEREKLVSLEEEPHYKQQNEYIDLNCYPNCQNKLKYNIIGDNDEQTRLHYNRKIERCTEETPTDRNKLTVKSKDRGSCKNKINRENKCDGLKEVHDQESDVSKYLDQIIYGKCKKTGRETHRKEEHCDNKRDHHNYRNKNCGPSDMQPTKYEEQLTCQGKQQEKQGVNQSCERKKSSDKLVIRVVADEPFQVDSDNQTKCKHTCSSEDDRESFYTSQESMSCRYCNAEETCKKELLNR